MIPGLLLSLFFNPSVLRTPPLYFAVQNTEEEGILDSVAVAVFNPSVFLTPSPYGHSPYLICDEQRERRPESVTSTAGIS